ncbi:MAG: LPS export ABC transporter ATP-binding protein [Crocinitomix sp.]|nr:LPS export ABC transporter ATP-binding protein [Crocinitomix sp.]
MKLRTDSIKKSYKGRQVVQGVSIEVNQGEIVGLLGPNGAGKTTSFYMIVGLVRPNSGSVYLDDLDITRHAMYKRAQLGIGYLPQEVSVFRKMSVEDNIMTVLEMTDLNKAERHAKLESLLEEFGLNLVRKNLGQSLSGGEKRRTEIARALATDPKFILLDEPFAGVDPIAVEDIQKIVYQLKKRNIGVLITDHNVQETLSITDRTYLLFEGSILREGTAESLAADEMVRKVYLGESFVLRSSKDFDKEDSNESAEHKEDRVKSSQEKNVDYIDNVINVAKRAQSSLTGSNMNSNAIAGVVELVDRVKELKEYFLIHELGHRSGEVYNEIKFGPVTSYKMPFNLNGAELLLYIFIPIFGWIGFFVSRSRLLKCKSDIDILVGRLQSFKHLVENPEMEKIL